MNRHQKRDKNCDESAEFNDYYDLTRAINQSNLRSVAISAGDLRSAVLQEVRRVLKENHGNQISAIQVGLERMKAKKYINNNEATQLSNISELIISVQRGKTDPTTAENKIRLIYNQFVIDDNSNSLAIAIASIAVGSFSNTTDEQENPTDIAKAATGNGGDAGMVGGAVGGAIIGGAIGGAAGAVIGAVIGGIAGGIAGACGE